VLGGGAGISSIFADNDQHLTPNSARSSRHPSARPSRPASRQSSPSATPGSAVLAPRGGPSTFAFASTDEALMTLDATHRASAFPQSSDLPPQPVGASPLPTTEANETAMEGTSSRAAGVSTRGPSGAADPGARFLTSEARLPPAGIRGTSAVTARRSPRVDPRDLPDAPPDVTDHLLTASAAAAKAKPAAAWDHAGQPHNELSTTGTTSGIRTLSPVQASTDSTLALPPITVRRVSPATRTPRAPPTRAATQPNDPAEAWSSADAAAKSPAFTRTRQQGGDWRSRPQVYAGVLDLQMLPLHSIADVSRRPCILLSEVPTAAELSAFERGGARVYRLPAPQPPSALSPAALTARARAALREGTLRVDNEDEDTEARHAAAEGLGPLQTYPPPPRTARPLYATLTASPAATITGAAGPRPPPVRSTDVGDHIRALRDPSRQAPRPSAAVGSPGPSGMQPRSGASVRSIPRAV
jgi:hypothetical protein